MGVVLLPYPVTLFLIVDKGAITIFLRLYAPESIYFYTSGDIIHFLAVARGFLKMAYWGLASKNLNCGRFNRNFLPQLLRCHNVLYLKSRRNLKDCVFIVDSTLEKHLLVEDGHGTKNSSAKLNTLPCSPFFQLVW